jgi:hypothetical protein
MKRKLLVLGMLLVSVSIPMLGVAEREDVAKSSSWSALVHEENSILASVLYIPYIFVQIPGRILDGIFNSKPTSRATVPPPAQREAE